MQSPLCMKGDFPGLNTNILPPQETLQFQSPCVLSSCPVQIVPNYLKAEWLETIAVLLHLMTL